MLQSPQQFHLQGQGDVGHLVEKDRAPVGLFQQSLAGLIGAGECAAGMAEQLALGQRGAERGDVDRHKRPVRAAAVAMDGAGHQFLAGAAVAVEVDAGVGGGDQGDAFEDLLHGRRGADDLAAGGLAGRRRRVGLAAGHGPQRPLDGPLDHRQVERLGEVIEGPVAPRRSRRWTARRRPSRR